MKDEDLYQKGRKKKKEYIGKSTDLNAKLLH